MPNDRTYQQQIDDYLETVTLSESESGWPVAVLPDGRRVEFVNVQWERDEDGAGLVAEDIRHDDGRELSDEESDEIDWWAADFMASCYHD